MRERPHPSRRSQGAFRLVFLAAVLALTAWPGEPVSAALTAEEAKLVPSLVQHGDWFGDAVAVGIDVAVVGAPRRNGQAGAAFVYEKTDDGWRFVQELRASDGATNDFFGSAVALYNNVLVVGSPSADVPGIADAGAVYLFTRNGGPWAEAQKISASDAQTNGGFGKAVAVDGADIVVGAPGQDVFSGRVYVFGNSGSGWTERQKLSPSLSPSFFGFSVGISNGTIVVLDEDGPGRCYVFRFANSTWTQSQVIDAPYALDVAIGGSRLVIGRPNVAGAQYSTASVYMFDGMKWTFEQDLQPDGRSSVYGGTVAISGSRIVVGNDYSDVNLSAYVFTRSGGAWAEELRQQAPSGSSDDFGADVAVFGNNVVVGQPRRYVPAPNEVGAAYAYTFSGGVWSPAQELSLRMTKADTYLGTGVAVDGDTAVVGAPFDASPAGDTTGAAYVFQRVGNAWTLRQKLVAEGLTTTAEFGSSVAIRGDTIVVGAEDQAGQGAVYVFVRSGASWVFHQRLDASDPSAGADFGSGVALDGDLMIVGARRHSSNFTFEGAAFVFRRSGETWTEEQKLVSDTPTQGEYFGWSVGLSGNTAVVGAYRYQQPAGFLVGAAHVFVRSGATWTRQQKLLPDVIEPQYFGTGVAISGDTIAVGALGDSDDAAGIDLCGSIRIFTRTAGVWTQRQKLYAPDRAADDQLGASIAMTADTIVAGAPWDDTPAGENSGSVYVFSRNGATWSYNTLLVASDAAANDYTAEVSASVAVSGDTAVVGAYLADVDALRQSGAAYAYRVPAAAPVCGNGVVDAGEACDDGPTPGVNCCSAACAFVGVGEACGDPCTTATCTAAGPPPVCTAGDPLAGCAPAGSALGQLPGQLVTPDQSVTLTVPAEAVNASRTYGIASGLTESQFGVGTQASRVLVARLSPDGVTFAPPGALLEFRWPDADDDGLVDGTAIAETSLRVYQDGQAITATCAEIGGCGSYPCCNASLNRIAVRVTSFSEFVILSEPCVTVRCAIDDVLRGSLCAGTALPRSVATKLDHALGQAELAPSQSARKAGKLRKAAKRSFTRASRAAGKAARGKHPKLTAECATGLRQAISVAIERVGFGFAVVQDH